MRLSKTQLRLLGQVAIGNSSIAGIAEALRRDKSKIYRSIKSMDLELSEGKIRPSGTTHMNLLLQLLAHHSSIITPFSGCGISLFTSLLEPKRISEIKDIKRSMVYLKLKEAKRISLIIIKDEKYEINGAVWPQVKLFLAELKAYEETTDRRIPPGAVIYQKDGTGIVFSCKEQVDATLTAFSAFKDFGIPLFSQFNFYYLPKKTLSAREIFRHAVSITEKDRTVSNIIYIALFYLKHKVKGIRSEIIDNIRRAIKGEKIKGYPSKEEIEEKAELYDIKV